MRILVVDDDLTIRDVVRDMIIDSFDTTVVMGINGQDGWREFLESQPDLVITDLQMETKDAGLELAKKIKEISPATPVIMITTAQYIEAGVIDYLLSKPFKEEDLVEKIKELLGRRVKDVLRN